MVQQTTAHGPRLRTKEAAEYLGIAESTLEKMRPRGDGPEFERPAPKIVVYSIAALEKYLAERRSTGTSEPARERREPRPGRAPPNEAAAAVALGARNKAGRRATPGRAARREPASLPR